MGAFLEDSQFIKVARALSDPTRFGILRALASDRELSCGEIARQFPVSQGTVSHHVRILVESGLVRVRRAGQFHYFRVVRPSLEEFRRALGQVTKPARA